MKELPLAHPIAAVAVVIDIFHPIDDLLFGLFPDAKGDRTALMDLLRKFYSHGNIEPKVSVENDLVRAITSWF